MSHSDTVFPADSVEFCPHPEAHNILLCGTYKLNEPSSAQKRSGTCLVFKTHASDLASKPTLEKIQEINLPAIPDIKWCHRSDSAPPVAAIADTEGHVSLHRWSFDKSCLQDLQSVQVTNSDTLCLSLDWSNRRVKSTNLGSLAASLSNGSLALLVPTTNGELETQSVWHAHDYEPWIVAWDYWDTQRLYSGGDDLSLKVWDLRQSLSSAVATNKRFDAGVTTIQSHPHQEHVVAVGSYDETVRLYDTRMIQRPFIQQNVGSGPWRVKWHPSPSRQADLLVACMRDGFKVLRFGEHSSTLDSTGASYELVTRFDEHDPESLCYGVDWSHDPSVKEGTLVASCSFYDHLLHLWYG